MPRPRQDIIGMTFGYWTILGDGYEKQTPSGIKRVIVSKCRCGTIRAVLEQNIISGKSKSCGCLQRQRAKEFKSAYWANKKAIK